MAIQYRGTGTSGNSGAATVTSQAVTLPTGWQAGDILFTVLRVGSSAVTGFAQTGGTGTWTIDFSAADGTANLFYAFAHRVMAAGDTGPTFGWTTASSTCWSCGGFFSTVGAALVLDKWATGDPLIVNTAATSSGTLHSAAAAGGSEASVVLTCCRASATGSATSHTYTPPSGWTWNDGDGSFFAGGLNARFAANAYQLGVSGTVAPGAETLTDSASDTFFWIAAHALVQEAVPPSRPPGRVSLRVPLRARLGRFGACAAGVLAAAAAAQAPVPARPARPLPVIAHLAPHRAIPAAGGVLAKTTLAPVPPSVPPSRPAPAIGHLPPHRAQFRKLAAPAPLAFLAAKLPPTAVSSRPPHRAVVRGTLAKTTLSPQPVSVSVLPQPVPVRRPAPHRAAVKGILAPAPIPAQPGATHPPQWRQQPVRVPRRAQWRGITAPPPAVTAAVPPPAWHPQPRSAPPHRATAKGAPARTTLAAQPSAVPPPPWRPQPRFAPPHRGTWRGAAARGPVTPPFTVGALSAATAPQGTLTPSAAPESALSAATAPQGTLTAATQTQGGPS